MKPFISVAYFAALGSTDAASLAGTTCFAEIARRELAKTTDAAIALDAIKTTKPVVASSQATLSPEPSGREDETWTDHAGRIDLSSTLAAGEAIVSSSAADPFVLAVDPDRIEVRRRALTWRLT